MNGLQIEQLLPDDNKVRDIFVGVFPADRLPNEKGSPGLYIVKEHPSNKHVQHWVAFYSVAPNVVKAFDSFGRNLGEYYST